MEKVKTVDFSETIAASDLKQMDLMKVCESTLYESFQVQGNENLMT